MTATQLSNILNGNTFLELAILIGSRATGTARPGSDWDIAIQWSRKLDFIQQLAGRNRDENVVHGPYANNSSIFAVTRATSIRSITPGTSIFRVQGNASGNLPQNRRAACAYSSTHHRRER